MATPPSGINRQAADTGTEPSQPGVGHSCVYVPLPIKAYNLVITFV